MLNAIFTSSNASHPTAASSLPPSPCVPTMRLRCSTSATRRIGRAASSEPGTPSAARYRAVFRAVESCFTADV
ncbi:MAG: hypothetical protein ACLU9X_14245 [Alistipes shahii]